MTRLSVLAGSGGSLEVGIPTTPGFTQHLANVTQHFPVQDPTSGQDNHNVLGAILTGLAGHHHTPNFEHALNTLEAIHSLRRTWNGNAVEPFRVVEGRLTSGPAPDLAHLFDENATIEATNALYREIGCQFSQASTAALQNGSWSDFQSFWQDLGGAFDLEVGTLNYETCIEQALSSSPDPSVEGFEFVSGESAHRFNPTVLETGTRHVMHLHGSIRFGYRGSNVDPNRFIFEDDFEDLYWHEDPSDAQATWGGRSVATAQSGAYTFVGPVVTGMRKVEKVLAAEPYSAYFRRFAESLRGSLRLLVIGYGFGDLYMNSLLSRMARWHGDDRRIVCISHCSPSAWQPADWWAQERPGLFRVVARWSRMPRPLHNLQFQDPWVSDDGRCRIYFGGFINTATNHASDIASFLSS